jgi:hypothetical protein
MAMSEHRFAEPGTGTREAASSRPVAEVVESAVSLARAEGALALSRARTLSIRAVLAGIFAFATLSLAQVSLILLALSGVIVRFSSASDMALGLAPALILTALCGLLAFLNFRKLAALDGAERKGKSRAE